MSKVVCWHCGESHDSHLPPHDECPTKPDVMYDGDPAVSYKPTKLEEIHTGFVFYIDKFKRADGSEFLTLAIAEDGKGRSFDVEALDFFQLIDEIKAKQATLSNKEKEQ